MGNIGAEFRIVFLDCVGTHSSDVFLCNFYVCCRRRPFGELILRKYKKEEKYIDVCTRYFFLSPSPLLLSFQMIFSPRESFVKITQRVMNDNGSRLFSQNVIRGQLHGLITNQIG